MKTQIIVATTATTKTHEKREKKNKIIYVHWQWAMWIGTSDSGKFSEGLMEAMYPIKIRYVGLTSADSIQTLF